MTTVAQLIAHLQTLPADALVLCGTLVDTSYGTGLGAGNVDTDNTIVSSEYVTRLCGYQVTTVTLVAEL